MPAHRRPDPPTRSTRSDPRREPAVSEIRCRLSAADRKRPPQFPPRSSTISRPGGPSRRRTRGSRSALGQVPSPEILHLRRESLRTQPRPAICLAPAATLRRGLPARAGLEPAARYPRGRAARNRTSVLPLTAPALILPLFDELDSTSWIRRDHAALPAIVHLRPGRAPPLRLFDAVSTSDAGDEFLDLGGRKRPDLFDAVFDFATDGWRTCTLSRSILHRSSTKARARCLRRSIWRIVLYGFAGLRNLAHGPPLLQRRPPGNYPTPAPPPPHLRRAPSSTCTALLSSTLRVFDERPSTLSSTHARSPHLRLRRTLGRSVFDWRPGFDSSTQPGGRRLRCRAVLASTRSRASALRRPTVSRRRRGAELRRPGRASSGSRTRCPLAVGYTMASRPRCSSAWQVRAIPHGDQLLHLRRLSPAASTRAWPRSWGRAPARWGCP